MAIGDVVWFNQFKVDEAQGLHTLTGASTIQVGLTDGTTTPVAATPDPRWGTGGSTNFLAEQVAIGGNYSGPVTLATFLATLNNARCEYDTPTNPSWAQSPANPANATWGVIFNVTAANRCLGFVDIGGTFDMTTGNLLITWGTPYGFKS